MIQYSKLAGKKLLVLGGDLLTCDIVNKAMKWDFMSW